MLANFEAYFAFRLPAAIIASRRLDYEPTIWSGGEQLEALQRAETVITASVALDRPKGIALGALRRASPAVKPVFIDRVSAVITVQDSPLPPRYRGNDGRYLWRLADWLAADEEDFALIADWLDQQQDLADQRNAALAAELRQHPANIEAMAHIARQAAVIAEAPTPEVDRFLAERLGYSLQRQAGWSATTRSRRRKEARQIMSGQAVTL